MSITEKGLYRKYTVQRVDGSSGPGGKHEACAHFVLDLVHDPHAAAALMAYARSCAAEHPQLARDLRRLDVGRVCEPCGGKGLEGPAQCGCREAMCPHEPLFPKACPSCDGWGVAQRKTPAAADRVRMFLVELLHDPDAGDTVYLVLHYRIHTRLNVPCLVELQKYELESGEVNQVLSEVLEDARRDRKDRTPDDGGDYTLKVCHSEANISWAKEEIEP